MDGVLGRSLHFPGGRLFYLLLFHVQLQPTAGTGTGYGVIKKNSVKCYVLSVKSWIKIVYMRYGESLLIHTQL
ncbi:hypothetical protein DESC_830113 [Desulfosarcina cetonica]|nr:hypothetical protein DESC_830113 [Desulfosarcina cetonica]